MIEALVALSIAALLTAALTRLVSTTRMNAGKIREFVEMMALSNSLLERVSEDVPDTSYGRTGRYVWHVDVTPMTMSAVARQVVRKSATENQSTSNGPGLGPLADFNLNAPISDDETAPKPNEGAKWVPFHVTILVESPSGRRYVTDTVSVGHPQTKE